MKTYAEIVNQITFPETVDEPLQQTIYDWFQFREVADDEKFPFWFVRLLNRDISQYDQLLRIEPGISSYDWLVSKYRELQIETTGTMERAINIDLASEITDNGQNSKSVTRTLEKDGTVTDETSYGKVSTHAGGHTITDGTSVVNGTVASVDTRQKTTSGGWTDTQTDGRVITDVKDVETVGADDSFTDTRGFNVKNDKTLQKQAPMSMTYPNGVDEPVPPSGSSGGTTGGALDWTTATAQGANFGRDDHGETVTEHQGHIRNTDERSVTGNLQNGRAYNGLAETHSGGVTTTTNQTQTRNYADIDNGSLTLSGADTNEKTIDTIDTEHVTDSGTNSNSKVIEATTATRNNTTDEKTQRQIYTGRDEDPAELLKKASTFIKNSCAFEWLQKQLEVCFMGVYD